MNSIFYNDFKSYTKVKQEVKDEMNEKIPKSHRQYAAAFAFFEPCYAEEKEHFKFTTINLILIELSFFALSLSFSTKPNSYNNNDIHMCRWSEAVQI